MKNKIFFWTKQIVLFWILLVFLPSIPSIRNILACPLIVSNKNTKGDAAYVLAGGYAFRERLLAASDLYQMNKIQKIIILKNTSKSSFHFIENRNLSLNEWWVKYLKWLDVPSNNIVVINDTRTSFWGTLNEANILRDNLDKSIQKLVLVTSAPHTRRTLLTFNRVCKNVEAISYAASRFEGSIEMYEPLWLEYLKLIVYFLVA